MKINLKKLIGVTAIAGTLGLPAVVGAGAANAAAPAPSIPGPVHTVQTPADPGPTHVQPVDWGWGGGGWGGHGGWGHGGWDRGGWGRGGWDRGGWGHGGWGGRGGWGW